MSERMEAKVQLLLLKGLISDMPETDRNRINELVASIKALVADNEVLGVVALSIAAIEAQLEVTECK